MNTTQIKCFLALSETLNFTKAAAGLYLSQPALSRQIVTLEQELNTQLFIRDSKNVRLTPAGTLLASELGDISASLEELVSRVQTVGRGYSGMLTVGVLEGQWMGDTLIQLCRAFIQRYPNIDFRFQQGSFGQLRQQLSEGKLDAAITLEFDIREMHGVMWRVFEPDSAVFAASRSLEATKKETIRVEDLLKETILVISPKDSRAGHDKLIEHLKKFGWVPEHMRTAPNFSTMMLWIEAGLGVGIVNHFSPITQNPTIRLITEIPLEDASSCVVWQQNNLNPAISLFVEMIENWRPQTDKDML